LSETGPQDNPLVTNKKLRQMYVAMIEARLLDEHLAGLTPGKKARRLNSTNGEEACRVSTAIELRRGDLVSDAQVGVVMDLLFGAKIDPLLQHARTLASGKKDQAAAFIGAGAADRQLPWIEEIVERLQMAMGAALAFKTLKQPNIVVAYVHRGEASKKIWRQALSRSSKLALPIIFVILPATADHKKKQAAENISGKARSYGVPGIPVDARDAVALYRVAQESIGRTRGGDGPVLIECVGYRLKGKKDATIVDPIKQMKDFLLGRNVSDDAWLTEVETTFRQRLDTSMR